MKNKIKEQFKKIQNIDNNYYYILLIVLLLVMPLISTKYLYGHDVGYHIANIETIKNDFLNHNFSHIASYIANNFGYGGAIFYPKLPHVFSAIIAIIIVFAGMNGIYAMKLSQIIVVILSAYFMYKLLQEVFKNKNISLLGSIFYITLPYFMANIYVRSSLNETFMFLFMPIILLGLIHLLNKDYKKFYLYFIIGYLGMMNSHLVLTVYFTILVCFFLLINIKNIWNKETMTRLIKASLLILILEMPFVIEMLQHKSLGIYTVFESEVMGSKVSSITSRGLRLIDFINPSLHVADGIYKFFNVFLIAFSLIGIYHLIFKEKNKKIKIFGYGISLFTILALWMSSKYFPYQILPELLLSIQFAFRCLTFAGFGLSILGAYGLSIFSNKVKPTITKIVVILSVIIVLPFINQTTFYFISSMGYDTYSGMGWQREYLTTAAHENMDYLETRDDSVIILNEVAAEVNIIENYTPKLIFTVNNLEDNKTATLELPRLYYLGYDITLTTEDNEKIKLDYECDDYGFISIDVNTPGTITVRYTGTTLYKVSVLVSITTLLTILIIYLKRRKIIKSKDNVK